jgi:iduronate 2-sulfatase
MAGGSNVLLDFSDPENRDLTPDELNAQWAAKTLRDHANNPSGQPLFMAVGFVRPHTPLHAPQEFFDRFPEANVLLSGKVPNDTDDTHLKTADPSDGKGIDKGYHYYDLLEESYGDVDTGVKTFLRAYLACVAAGRRLHRDRGGCR